MTCVGLEVTEKGKCKCDSYAMAIPRDVCMCKERCKHTHVMANIHVRCHIAQESV